MISGKLNWHGDEAIATIRAASWERLLRAAVFFWQKCVEAVGISNPRPHDQPSAPGEPPRKRTGAGQRGIQYEADKDAGRVRVGATLNAIYMLYLDQGTRRVLPRPWLLATLMKHLATIRSLAGGSTK